MIPIARPVMGDDEKKVVLDVLSSGILTQGPNVVKFEKEFAKYLEVKQAIAVNSGTAALHLSMLALGLNPGDEVITTSFSFTSSANCILYVDAKPVFVDIDSRTFNIDAGKIKDKITEKTKAILPVHLYGQPAKMDEIVNIAEKHGLKVIEDACQAHGAEYKGKKVGGLGDISAFSFYPTKNMTTCEGGMITTNSDEIADKVRVLRNIGQSEQYRHVVLGFNYRMPEMQAAIGIVQLKKLDVYNNKRIQNAKFYSDAFSSIDGIATPFTNSYVKHVFHQYTIRVHSKKTNRDLLMKKLEKDGIGTKVYYPIPIHKQPLYKEMGFFTTSSSLPESEKAAEEVLSIPVYPSLKDEELEFIAQKIKSNLI